MLSTARSTMRVARPQVRSFFGVANKLDTNPGGVFVTKYKIVRPGKEGVDWDDFLIAQPEREQLASTHKEIPLFVKYLKLVTDLEKRGDDFVDFMKRATNGLQVEADVYITCEELLGTMWKNGYTDKERTSLQFTFPSDYKFHYPELAVLFNLSEEDCYKYCMRIRMEKSHIGQLQTNKVMKKGWVRDHWLIFGAGAFIFKTFPFFNYYFVLKGFGTCMWIWTLYGTFNRWMSTTINRNQYMAQQKTAADVMEGEDKIMAAMSRFGNDSKCLDALADFKTDLPQDMADYRKALIQNEKNQLIMKAQKQLDAIRSFEDSSNAKLQESIVNEIKSEFKEKFSKDQGMQGSAFTSAVESLSGNAKAGSDPVSIHFQSSLKSIDLSGGARANKEGSVSERLAYLQKLQEEEFVRTFYVTAAESDAVKKESDAGKKESMMNNLYNKCGFHVTSDLSNLSKVQNIGDGSVGDAFAAEASKALADLDSKINVAKGKVWAGSLA